MNRDRDTAREIIVLTDAELDAVAGGVREEGRQIVSQAVQRLCDR